LHKNNNDASPLQRSIGQLQFKEIIVVYLDKHMKAKYKLRWQNADTVNVKTRSNIQIQLYFKMLNSRGEEKINSAGNKISYP
jgi:hypothetical protein